jgi:transcription elongation factor GreA
MNKHYLTKEKLAELKEELETLKGEKRQEIAERLKTAKDYGDLSENSEYSEAREEQAKVETRIFELEEMLKQISIIEKGGDSNEVGVGSTVTVSKGSSSFKYVIVGSNETNPEEGRISNESPLGQALIGHKVGDSVDFNTPAGEVVYKITKIE